jgi:hypothetical protein
MIISVEEARKHIGTDMEDSVLEAMLQALELAIRGYTNNNFLSRGIRYQCSIVAQKVYLKDHVFEVGDTVQISGSFYNNGIYTITEVDEDFITLNEKLVGEPMVKVTKVVYPKDVQMGVLNMLKWDIENRDKVGIASETISRHSVTYYDQSASNTLIGYPAALVGFLKPYAKARF